MTARTLGPGRWFRSAPERYRTTLQRLKRHNAELNDLELLLGRAQLRSVPSHLEVDFSIHCNFRCRMCHQSKRRFAPSRLDAAAIDAAIDQLPYLETVLVAGLGEPLLVGDLDRFLPAVDRFGCAAHLFTNGQLIDRRLELFAHLAKVSVSFDGATAATFEFLRAGADFEQILRNLRALRACHPDLRIAFSTVVSHANLLEVASIVEIAADLDVDEVNLSPVHHTPELALLDEDRERHAQIVAKAREIARSAGVALHDNLRDVHFGMQAPTARPVAARIGSEGLCTDCDRRSEPAFRASQATSLEEIERELERVSEELARACDALRERLACRADGGIEEPYCTAPWKYRFLQNDGNARLCPYADVVVGTSADGILESYNSELLTVVRDSLTVSEPRLEVCQHCTDDHRRFRLASTRRTAEALGLPLRSRGAAPLASGS